MNVIKRDGSEVQFDKSRIFTAISNASKSVPEGQRMTEADIHQVTDKVVQQCEEMQQIPKVEEIQDLVEKGIMEEGYFDVAKAYVIYRYKRTLVRQNQTLTEKLTASNVQNQNANVDEMSFGGRLGEAASYITKQYALDHLMSKMAARNHLNNEIYTHDLDSYALGSHNCLSIPFDKLLAEGFNTRQVDIRPAGSVDTAFQLVAVIFQLQSLQQFGGVAATHLDWTMVPYLRKSFYKHYNDGLLYIEKVIPLSLSKEDVVKTSITDKSVYSYGDAYVYAMDKTVQELDQAVEGMYHNLELWVA